MTLKSTLAVAALLSAVAAPAALAQNQQMPMEPQVTDQPQQASLTGDAPLAKQAPTAKQDLKSQNEATARLNAQALHAAQAEDSSTPASDATNVPPPPTDTQVRNPADSADPTDANPDPQMPVDPNAPKTGMKEPVPPLPRTDTPVQQDLPATNQ
ncbi:hypothetical protein PQU92_15540 [Asticcacaulis sp. BYS171W]|uniref:Uncharacterized protein n=1 Tax=Asticcacaulis aquaticus TaxID=2984212 RepID=A0ABT5HXL3_9CAUL|nr:hypothetical protein [Asticcacaulis aquaticus]MDC7684698.1 hypothetical protein [Asticcacaulis aquaticus]